MIDTPLLLLLDAPRAAPWNMARDEALLDGFRTVLRRTAWHGPAATIGRFQDWAILEHPEYADGGAAADPALSPFVAPIRRITGGGAIFHGTDLTLAWVANCPSPFFPERTPTAIARRAARAILPAIAPFHRGARTRDGEFAERAQRGVVDCFAGKTPFDLVVEGDGGALEKVGGLAMHRRGDRILVQVSIVRGENLTAEKDREVLEGIALAIGAGAVEIEDLDPYELDRALDLSHARYARHGWNRRRVPIRETSG